MKKAISLFITTAFITLSIISFSGCEIVHLNDIPEETTTPAPETAVDIVILPPKPEYPYIADTNMDKLLNINASELPGIDYEGATVEYVYSTEFTTYIVDEMTISGSKAILNCLKLLNASDRIDEEFTQMVGVGPHDFRITLSTGEKIYIGVRSGDIFFVNGTPYECDDEQNFDALYNYINIIRRFEPPDSLIPIADRTKEVNGTELAALIFDGAQVEYIVTDFSTEILGKMPADYAESFFECLKASEISSEIDNDFSPTPTVGDDSIYGFRITLNSNEKIFVGVNTDFYDGVFINGTPYKCDKETLEKLESMLKE